MKYKYRLFLSLFLSLSLSVLFVGGLAGLPRAGATASRDHAARRTKQRATDGDRRRRWGESVDAARDIPLVDVVRRLGLGDPVNQGKRLVLRCPLHEDHRPSMSLDPDKGLWYCFPCAEGGDGIRLWMRTRRVDFTAAVQELTRSVEAA